MASKYVQDYLEARRKQAEALTTAGELELALEDIAGRLTHAERAELEAQGLWDDGLADDDDPDEDTDILAVAADAAAEATTTPTLASTATPGATRVRATDAQIRDPQWAFSNRENLRKGLVDRVDGATATPTPAPARSAGKGDRVKATSADLRNHEWAWANRNALRENRVDLVD